uniref:Uncharacterized protein n=1 Tax=Rhizophora mucronata TaxID=61149 RepID=A0A2P2N875_RHIMU
MLPLDMDELPDFCCCNNLLHEQGLLWFSRFISHPVVHIQICWRVKNRSRDLCFILWVLLA